MSELPSSEDLDPSTGTDAPTPPTTTGPSSYTLNWEEPVNGCISCYPLNGHRWSAGGGTGSPLGTVSSLGPVVASARATSHRFSTAGAVRRNL